MALTEVCKIADVAPGTAKHIKLDGRDPIAVYHLDGEFFVTDDICTHGHALLSVGEICNGAIVCAFHGGSFDIRTGIAVGRPCFIPLRTYHVATDGDAVLVELEAAD